MSSKYGFRIDPLSSIPWIHIGAWISLAFQSLDVFITKKSALPPWKMSARTIGMKYKMIGMRRFLSSLTLLCSLTRKIFRSIWNRWRKWRAGLWNITTSTSGPTWLQCLQCRGIRSFANETSILIFRSRKRSCQIFALKGSFGKTTWVTKANANIILLLCS